MRTVTINGVPIEMADAEASSLLGPDPIDPLLSVYLIAERAIRRAKSRVLRLDAPNDLPRPGSEGNKTPHSSTARK